MPAPWDLVGGLGVLMGLVALMLGGGEAGWGRQIATFAWMCSRVWPSWIHDPYALTDAVVILVGGLAFGFGLHRRVKPQVGVRAMEIVYVLFAMLPTHGKPHVALGAAFALTCACVWRARPEDRDAPEGLLRSTGWILCLKSPISCVVPVALDAWMLREILLAKPSPPVLPITAAGTPVTTTTTEKPPRPPAPLKRLTPEHIDLGNTRRKQVDGHLLHTFEDPNLLKNHDAFTRPVV